MYQDGEITLYVMNLPYNVEYHNLRDIFASFGPVAHVFLKKDKVTQKCSGAAYVTFLRESDGLKAMQQLEGANYNGNILRVKEAIHSSARMFHQQFKRSNQNFGPYRKFQNRKQGDKPSDQNQSTENKTENAEQENENEEEDGEQENGDGEFVLEEEPDNQNTENQSTSPNAQTDDKNSNQTEKPSQEQIFQQNGLQLNVRNPSPRPFRRNHPNSIRPYERSFNSRPPPPRYYQRNEDYRNRNYDPRFRSRDDDYEDYEYGNKNGPRMNQPPMDYRDQPNGPPSMPLQPIFIPVDPSTGLIMNPQGGLLPGGLQMAMVPVNMPGMNQNVQMMPPDMEMNNMYGPPMPQSQRQYRPQYRDRRNQRQWNNRPFDNMNNRPLPNRPNNYQQMDNRDVYDYRQDSPPVPQTIHNAAVSPINRQRPNMEPADDQMEQKPSLIERFQNQPQQQQSYQRQPAPSPPGYTPPLSARNAGNVPIIPPREMITQVIEYEETDSEEEQ